MATPWEGFVPGRWQEKIDVRDFTQINYTPYTGNEDFLAPATERTKRLMHKLQNLMSLGAGVWRGAGYRYPDRHFPA